MSVTRIANRKDWNQPRGVFASAPKAMAIQRADGVLPFISEISGRVSGVELSFHWHRRRRCSVVMSRHVLKVVVEALPFVFVWRLLLPLAFSRQLVSNVLISLLQAPVLTFKRSDSCHVFTRQ